MNLKFLPFLLLVVPILEISLFVVLGGKIGAIWTIALVLFTAILGSILLRIEGFRTFTAIRDKMNAGQMPGEELAKGVMILIAGVLLLTPGFLTDSIGFALFVPFVRQLIWQGLASRFTSAQFGGTQFNDGPHAPHDPDGVILDPDDFSEETNDDSPWSRKLDSDRSK